MTRPGVADIDAIVFDLGNVVVEIDFDRVVTHWAASAGVDPARVRSRFSHDGPYQRHERDEIGTPEYFASLRSGLGIDLTDAQFLDGWSRVFVREIEPVVKLLPRLAARVPLYVFSNTNRAHHEEFARRFAQALEPFSRVFVSHELGRRKPEREAFEAIAREIGAPANRILFLDDLEENVGGARAAGMHAVLVRSPGDVQAAASPWLK